MVNLITDKIFLLLASILISAIFFVAGIEKVSNYDSTVERLLQKSIFNLFPKLASQMAIIFVIALEIIAPLIIVLAVFNENYKNLAYNSSLALAAFTLIVTLLFHFPPKKIHYYFFMKNTAIVGGLITLALLFK